MSDLGAIFHVKKNGVQYDAHAYTTHDECPEPNLKLMFNGQQAYVKLVNKGNGDIPCFVKPKGGAIFQVNSIGKGRPSGTQIFVVKATKEPFYNTNWKDAAKITNVDKSVSGQVTVTCKDVTSMKNMFTACQGISEIDLSSFDTSKVTEMYGMFQNCISLTTLKGIIDMKSCTRWNGMFSNCNKLTGVKIKNPPSGFDGAGLNSSQYTIV